MMLTSSRIDPHVIYSVDDGFGLDLAFPHYAAQAQPKTTPFVMGETQRNTGIVAKDKVLASVRSPCLGEQSIIVEYITSGSSVRSDNPICAHCLYPSVASHPQLGINSPPSTAHLSREDPYNTTNRPPCPSPSPSHHSPGTRTCSAGTGTGTQSPRRGCAPDTP